MIARLQWAKSPLFSVQGETDSVCTLPLYQIQLSPQKMLLSYRLNRSFRLLQQRRIYQILPSTSYPPSWDGTLPQGFRHPFVLDALQGLGDLLLLHQLEQCHFPPHHATVLLTGKRVTPSVEKVALALSPQVKEVLIAFPEGGTALQDTLYRRFGMAPRPNHDTTTAVISFEGEREIKTGIYLQLQEETSPDFCSIQLKKGEIPPDIPSPILLGLLLGTGKIQENELEFT